MTRVRTIHHFEDEPEKMCWIPGTLLNAYWADHPPAHLMLQVVARLLGWKPQAATQPALPDIAAMPPPGLAVAPAGDFGMPAPVLDVELLRARNRARLANRPETM